MIRKSNPTDIDQILNVLQKYDFTVLKPENNPILDPRFGNDFVLVNSIFEYTWKNAFVAEHEGKIVGYCHYRPLDTKSVKTTLLTVLPEYRQMGFGKQLQLARMKHAYDSGYTAMLTNSEHPDSILWYQKHFGYVIKGQKTSSHELGFFRLPNKIIWGLHYGFKEYEMITKLFCDLDGFFVKR